MSEKHNENPTTRRKQSRYRKTIDLSSASGWDAFNLDLFHVDFEPEQHDDLAEVVGNEFYKIDPADEFERGIDLSVASI